MQLNRTTLYGMTGNLLALSTVRSTMTMTLEDDRPHFFRHLGPQWWEHRGEVIVGGAIVQPAICVAGTVMPRISMLATYADNAGGLDASRSFGSVAPTLDLSVHVVHCPSTPDFTYESRLIKVGHRVIVAEAWFTATGELDPYAVAVSTFVIVSEPDPDGITLPSHLDPPFAPPIPLHVPIAEHVGITTVAPGVVDIEHRPSVGNSRGTLQGGMVALVTERACETLLDAEGVPHVVTSIDLRYLSSMRIGPVRTTAKVLRAHDALAQLWVEVRDLGTGHLMTHAVADAIPLDTFRVR
jgi:acyl-coenzyme A thioesterase PaaI-like protein